MSGASGEKSSISDIEPGASTEEKLPQITVKTRRDSSSNLSLKTPRTARFAEATSVNSPIGPTAAGRNPFAAPPINTTHVSPQPQVSDVGFGYLQAPSDDLKHTSIEIPLTPRSPLKSALKVPGTPGRFVDPRSPTFKEEVKLEKEEAKTDVQQVKDMKIKTRVRVAKFFLRGVNFSCSLIILSMLSTTFTIFNATKSIPQRNNLPPWALTTQPWPQIVLLSVACISLVICVLIFYSYWKGGHRRARRTTIYYTVFAIGYFIFSTVMWVVTAALMHSGRENGNQQDLWGWSCNNNKRATLFQSEVNYALVCRLQNWSLICAIIEIVIELLSIVLYSIVFYRFYSKRKLQKVMDRRDRARSDLYLAQLRTQSAPNTPGFIKSPLRQTTFASDLEKGDDGYFNQRPNGGDSDDGSDDLEAEKQYAKAHAAFHHHVPPVQITHATPVLNQDGFQAALPQPLSSAPTRPREQINEHGPVAPGEQTYEAVPIPGAYASTVPGIAR